ncbi:hypothetical protein THIAE_02675 [Thiomicrospira aerophila AL3]|uniref:DUF4381 domain-containing protein n=1 Tax=Thiomicrospira aerophila AL3 TaxID=717772 RepID=W0DZD5_9GAMM|nr:hypothetical protein [Thiomicrospira aerophila]AHF02196.1 hypothetical protein THIAE_02675 [Thiomicrospira aerophila AL3]
MSITQRADGWYDLAQTLDDPVLLVAAEQGLTLWPSWQLLLVGVSGLVVLAGLLKWGWRAYQAWYTKRSLQRLIKRVQLLGSANLTASERSIELRRVALAIYQQQVPLVLADYPWLYDACFSNQPIDPQEFYHQLQKAEFSLKRIADD